MVDRKLYVIVIVIGNIKKTNSWRASDIAATAVGTVIELNFDLWAPIMGPGGHNLSCLETHCTTIPLLVNQFC